MVAGGGAALGTVCVIDLVPRQLTAEQQEALRALSRQAVALLEARRSLRRLATSVGARERAEVSARAALELLRMTFTHAPVGMMITGVDGVLVEVNDALAGMLGRAPEALVGVHFAEITAVEDMESENALAARGRAGEIDTVVRSKRYRHADGSLIPAISTSSVIRDDDGTPTYSLSHVQGIADRRLAEETLLENQSATDAILGTDANDLITAWNTGATRLFGYRYDEVIGKPLTVIIPERLRSAHLAGLARVAAGGEPVLIGRTVEVPALRRDGSEFPAELSLSRWQRGGQNFYTGIVRDISERRTAEERAALIRSAAVAANTASTLDGALRQVLGAVCETNGWGWGRAWLTSDGARPAVAAEWSVDGALDPPAESWRDKSGADGAGLVARVRADREPVVVDAATDPAGRSLGVPVFARDEVVAVLEFAVPEGCSTPDAGQLGVLEQVGNQLGRVVERDRAGQEIATRTQELDEAQALAKLGSWSLDLVSGSLNWSDELFRICGLLPGSMVPDVAAFSEFVHPDDRHLLDLGQHSEQDEGFDVEVRLIRTDGRVRLVQGRGRLVRDAAGTPMRLVGTAQDVTERRELEQELLRQAVTDPLTGLGNRSRFTTVLTEAILTAAAGQVLTVLWMEVDGIKDINDTLGHGVGDQLLVGTAERLGAALRPGDALARVGGYEFAVLLLDAEPATSRRVAARLQAEVGRPAEVAGMMLDVEASVGIAQLRVDTVPDPTAGATQHATALVRNAALALGNGKAEGKGRIAVYEAKMHLRAQRRLSLHGELRRAGERGQLAVHYQPTVELGSARLLGAEALLRWRHPVLGSVSPVEFIPLAEETGLILSIGRWVLREACRQAAEWSPRHGWAGLPSISVNLSGRQLADDRIVGDVAAVLRETGLDPGRLTLEITESVLMADVERAIGRLTRLRRLGVRLAIDDFGTGYSSLGYLSRFPVEVLKVDKSFVDDISVSERSRMLAAAVVGLGDTLGMTTLAEGVESQDQRRVLEELGCQNGQGYLFGRPMPAVDFAAILPTPLQAVGAKRAG